MSMQQKSEPNLDNRMELEEQGITPAEPTSSPPTLLLTMFV